MGRLGREWVRSHRYLMALGLLTAGLASGACNQSPSQVERSAVESLVRQHAAAWEAGDTALLKAVLHEDARIAYPRRRVDRSTWLQEMDAFSEAHADTRIHIHRIVVDGQDFAVEWQFATTDRLTGIRTAVSDAIIGRVRAGSIVRGKQ